LTFRSISSNGASSGIVLNNTGASGGLTVSGTGTANSGGTIQNTTAAAISLTSTRSPSFDRMHVTTTAGQGIAGTGVTNFSFTNGTIDNTGTGHAVDSSNIGFNTVLGGTTANVSGAVTITGNSLSTSYYHGIDIQNYSGTISDLNISNNTFTSDTVSANSNGSAIRVDANDSASSAASI